jgi:UDP-N-acetylmuramoyl-L-alanyl-D-glutamate--2,6-diaminopimelate ligase
LSLKKHLSTEGKLWCVFGCGGDRDKGKRAQMGEAAESVADKLVITSDNPRSESNELIVIDILAGLSKPTQAYVEHDRTKAIELALREAESTDLILVAGKGHETYQEIQGVKYPYSDKKVVTSLLKAANDASHKMMRVSL